MTPIGPIQPVTAPTLRRLVDLIFAIDGERVEWDGEYLWLFLEPYDEEEVFPTASEDVVALCEVLAPHFVGAPAQAWVRSARWSGELPTLRQVQALFLDCDEDTPALEGMTASDGEAGVYVADPEEHVALRVGVDARYLAFHRDGSVYIHENRDLPVTVTPHTSWEHPVLWWCEQFL